MAAEAKAKASAERQAATIADLKKRGIIKDRTPEEEEAYQLKMKEFREMDDKIPWAMIAAVLVGCLLLMAILGALIFSIIITFSDVSNNTWTGLELMIQ